MWKKYIVLFAFVFSGWLVHSQEAFSLDEQSTIHELSLQGLTITNTLKTYWQRQDAIYLQERESLASDLKNFNDEKTAFQQEKADLQTEKKTFEDEKTDYENLKILAKTQKQDLTILNESLQKSNNERDQARSERNIALGATAIATLLAICGFIF